jgi:hypothetical protein
LVSWSAWVSHSSVILVPVWAVYCWNMGCIGSFQVVHPVMAPWLIARKGLMAV